MNTFKIFFINLSPNSSFPSLKSNCFPQQPVLSNINFAHGTNNNKGFCQTHLAYYFIIIRVATCFDPIGSSSGLHYEPVNYKVAYILGIPKQCLQLIIITSSVSNNLVK